MRILLSAAHMQLLQLQVGVAAHKLSQLSHAEDGLWQSRDTIEACIIEPNECINGMSQPPATLGIV